MSFPRAWTSAARNRQTKHAKQNEVASIFEAAAREWLAKLDPRPDEVTLVKTERSLDMKVARISRTISLTNFKF